MPLNDLEAPCIEPRISFCLESDILQVEMETQRLSIRSYRDEDFENCLALYGDEKLTKYFDYGKPRSRLEVEDLIKRNCLYFKRGEPFGLFSIFDKKDRSFIGLMDFIPFDKSGAVEIGCILSKQHHGRGIPFEALRPFFFNYIDEFNRSQCNQKMIQMSKIIATVHPENLPSKKVLIKFGMTYDKFQERFGNPRLWYSYIYKGLKR